MANGYGGGWQGYGMDGNGYGDGGNGYSDGWGMGTAVDGQWVGEVRK
jgi:hypothetical protein